MNDCQDDHNENLEGHLKSAVKLVNDLLTSLRKAEIGCNLTLLFAATALYETMISTLDPATSDLRVIQAFVRRHMALKKADGGYDIDPDLDRLDWKKTV